jgi:HNH endonuclease
MSSDKTPPNKPDKNDLNQMVDAVLSRRERLEKSYRERALKMFPWICARCGREFEEYKLRELTVHHKDHDHDNNPPDGSNWELLCLYCHDNEHSRDEVADSYGKSVSETDDAPSMTHKPFAGLEGLLKTMKDEKSED